MADNPLVLDNGLSTQRIIGYSPGTQVFKNAPGDASFSLDSGDTQDFYRIQLDRRSSLIITLNPLQGNADLEVLDSSGGVLQSSSNPGTLADAIVTDPLEAGVDYYIRIHNTADTSVQTDYTLKVDTIGPPQLDVLWRNYATGENLVLGMSGTSVVSINPAGIPIPDPAWSLETTGDFDGDGIADYVWRNYVFGQDVIWLMDSSSQIKSIAGLTAIPDLAWHIVGTGDFTGDAKTDLLWRNYTTGETVLWVMNGITQITTISMALNVPPAWRIDAATDMDGDSKPDILWRNYTTGENAIWFMDGPAIRAIAGLPPVGDLSYEIAGAGDFNGDGQKDILFRNYNPAPGNGLNIVWLMNGLQIAGIVPISQVDDPSWRIADVINTARVPDLAGNSTLSAFDIGTLNSSGSYEDSVGSSSDLEDFYQFTIASPTGSDLSLTLTGLDASTTLEIIQADGVVRGIPKNNLPGETQIVLTDTLPAGTYYIRIASSATIPDRYTLNLSAVAVQPINISTQPTSLKFLSGTTGTTPLTTIALSPSGLTAFRAQYSLVNESLVRGATFNVGFYISKDSTVDATDLLLDTNGVAGGEPISVTVAAGEQKLNVEQLLNLPDASDPFWSGDQTYYIGMIIDPGNQLQETNETDNLAFSPLTVTSTTKPDLIGAGLSAPGSTTISSAGPTTITVNGTVKNQGSVPTNVPSGFTVSIYLTRNADLSGGEQVGTGQVSNNIGSNLTGNFTASLDLPDSNNDIWVDPETGDLSPGTYYLYMIVDDPSVVQESNESNNLRQGVGIDATTINVSFV